MVERSAQRKVGEKVEMKVVWWAVRMVEIMVWLSVLREAVSLVGKRVVKMVARRVESSAVMKVVMKVSL